MANKKETLIKHYGWDKEEIDRRMKANPYYHDKPAYIIWNMAICSVEYEFDDF